MDPPRTPLITGWMKKEADKGLKVGNFIKKPFNDRWFVLDNVDRRLYYYEKQASEVPNGFIDLAKVTRLEKTGKNDVEFLVEVTDDVLGVKVYTLQAPSAAQMELWIKALNIVKEAAKPKSKITSAASPQPASSSAPSSKTAATPTPSTRESKTVASKTSESPNAKAFKEALEPKPSPAPTSPSTLSDVSPSSASLPKRTNLTYATQQKTPNSSEVPRGTSGGAFLGAQRSSMHPSTKPELRPNSVAARTANFESNGNKSNPNARWSVAKLPESKQAPSSSPSPASSFSTSSSLPPSSQSSPKPSTTSAPSNQASSSSTEASSPKIVSPPSSIIDTSAKCAEEKQKMITDTFRVGEQHITLRSSLSSLAPQPSGPLLPTDAEHVEVSVPLVKNYDESTSLKLSAGTARLAPAVPSPLSLLEEGIQRSYSSSNSSSVIYTADSSNGFEDDEKTAVQSPEQFVHRLRLSRDNPSKELCIRLNQWKLIGMNGMWAVQSNRGNVEYAYEGSSSSEDDSALTWQLPGFIQVRWLSFNKWHVIQRELCPSDEIKWDLVSIGKKLSTMDAYISVPRQALVYHLYSIVTKIMDHTSSSRSAYEIPLEQKAESLSTDRTLQTLIRSNLCTRIAAVLFDGFNDWSIMRKYHIWDFIHDAAIERSGLSDISSINLPLTVRDIAASSNNPNVRFRNFVISGLNARQLFAWISELFNNQPEVSDYYDDISLVRQIPSILLAAFAPLSELPLEMSLEKEKS